MNVANAFETIIIETNKDMFKLLKTKFRKKI